MAGYFYELAVFWRTFGRAKIQIQLDEYKYPAILAGNRLIRCLLYDCFLLILIKSLVFFPFIQVSLDFSVLFIEIRGVASIGIPAENRFVHSGL